MVTTVPEELSVGRPTPTRAGAGLASRFPWLSRSSTVPTYAGLVLSGLGFVLIAYAWGRIAGLTSVARQLPYLVSAGFTGLGLVVVGVTVISVQAKRQDAAARARQLEQLADTLDRVRVLVEERQERAP